MDEEGGQRWEGVEGVEIEAVAYECAGAAGDGYGMAFCGECLRDALDGEGGVEFTREVGGDLLAGREKAVDVAVERFHPISGGAFEAD